MPAPGPGDPLHVGVVCVHGIGFQEPGRTLLEWTDAIARALVAWRERMPDDALLPAESAAWPRDLTETSDIDLSGQQPSFVTFRIPGVAGVPSSTSQRWTFTESYWAARVEPPSLRLLVDWTGREGMVGKVVEGILKRNAKGPTRRLVEVAGVLWLGFFISAISSLILLAFSVIRSVLAIVPIPGLKDAVALGQGERFLVGWWGDARSLIRDPVQAANVRKALATSIENLRLKGCGQIVVLAHSGGTIVSYMTLSDPAYLGVRAATLITHGQAITLARRLEDLESDLGGVQMQPSVSRIKAVAERDDLRVDRWRDFHATHDPAPLAPPRECLTTVGAPPDRDLAIEITNLTSIREDHGGYWNNDEAFVLPVMTEIERAANGADLGSRFTRTERGADGRSFTDADGVKARASRVALRSLWGRLALAGPIVTIMLASAMAQGVVTDADPFDLPSDIVAANWTSIPLHQLGDTLAGWLDGRAASDGQPAQPGLIPDDWQARALQLTSATGFVLFAIAAFWAMIPVGGWRKHGPVGWGVADLFTSFVVFMAGVAAVAGLGPLPGIEWAGEFTIALQVVVVILAVSAIVFVMYEHGHLRNVPRTLLSSGIAVAVFVVAGAAVIAFVTDENTRRWIFNAFVAFILIRALVSIGMWRWRSWDAAERQWFRGDRATPKSRLVVYTIATALGILVAAVVAIWGGLAPEIAKTGFPGADRFAAITAAYGALLILFLVVRDVSTSESVRS